MGLEVTIAIVALTAPYGHFVCVSDQMISHDDILPADESALIKSLQISKNWSVTFSANKIERVLPLLDMVSGKMERDAGTLAGEAPQLQEYFTSSISETIQRDFFNRRLARYGYRDIEVFRRQGRDELGDHFFELCRELDEAELGAEFIVYGYDQTNTPRLFEVTGKGEVIDRMALRYAVVGSGYWMASASLKRKPLAIDFDSMVYRLLEAKFSAETASGVGRRTTVKFKRPDQHDFTLWPGQIEEIRAVWEGIQRHPEPQQAVEAIGKVRMAMMGDDKLRTEHILAEQAAKLARTGS
jgi:hypothetical protein